MARSQSAGSLVLPNLLPVVTPAMGLPAWSRLTSQAAHTGTVAGSKLVGCLAYDHLSACHLAVYYLAVCYLAVCRLDICELVVCYLVSYHVAVCQVPNCLRVCYLCHLLICL